MKELTDVIESFNQGQEVIKEIIRPQDPKEVAEAVNALNRDVPSNEMLGKLADEIIDSDIGLDEKYDKVMNISDVAHQREIETDERREKEANNVTKNRIKMIAAKVTGFVVAIFALAGSVAVAVSSLNNPSTPMLPDDEDDEV